MKKIWNQTPLVRLIIPFLAGTVMGIAFPSQPNSISLTAFVFFTWFAAITLIKKYHSSFYNSFFAGVLAQACLFLLAQQLAVLRTQKLDPLHFSNYTCGHAQPAIIRVLEPVVDKQRVVKAVAEVEKVYTRNGWRKTRGKVLVCFERSDRAMALQYGDEIILNTFFQTTEGPKNPGEFDYRKFLAHRNIYQQGYAKERQWVSTGHNYGNFFLRWSYNCRGILLHTMQKHGLRDNELSVGAALMLGDTDMLDADVMTSYSNTGALHVLSVSGLHAAIVYMVFSWLLGFLDKVRYGAYIKACLLILFLWFYASLTGLSPSVLRAATVFSFIIAAKALKKRSAIYNTLAASVFLLLLFEPELVTDVGFQLSYIAVVGIVWLQPMISSWFEPGNWLMRQIWSVTAVSVAAQLATFPLGLYYFHQFPNYFLLSNLIVIPLSTLIIYIGIFMFSVSSFPFFTKFVVVLFSNSVWLLNTSVKWMGSLPGASLSNISISVFEMLLLYSISILLVLFMQQKHIRYLNAMLVSVIILLCSLSVTQHLQLRQHSLVIYSIKDHFAMDLIKGKNFYFYSDSIFLQEKNLIKRSIAPYRCERGLESGEDRIIRETGISFCSLGEKSLVYVDSPVTREPMQKLKVDYLVIGKNADTDLRIVFRVFEPGIVVLDASNKMAGMEKWKEECNRLRIRVYSIPENGAFVAEL
jgi:competence protein ComEC